MFRNEIEIRVIGQMRNGNHAIIDWIRGLYPSKTICFLNNIRHGNFDPYSNFSQIEKYGNCEGLDGDDIRSVKKDVLIYSYEDVESLEVDNIDFLTSVLDEDFEADKVGFLGQSRHFFTVYIIRDPFNSFASRLVHLRRGKGVGGLKNVFLIKENWKVIARKVTDLSKDKNPSSVIVNYNRWIHDEEYCRKIAECLMGENWKKPISDISSYGDGSSFEINNVFKRLTLIDLFKNWKKVFSRERLKNIKSYIKRFIARPPKNAKLFEERWKTLVNDHEYKEMFADNEIFELSEEIFGHIPEVREKLKPRFSNNLWT